MSYQFDSTTAHSDGFSGSIGGNAGIQFGRDPDPVVEAARASTTIAVVIAALVVVYLLVRKK